MRLSALERDDQAHGGARLPDRVRYGLQALLFLPAVFLAAALITVSAAGTVSLVTQTAFGNAFSRLFMRSSLPINLVLACAGLTTTWVMYRAFEPQSALRGSILAWNRRTLQPGLTGALLGAGGQAMVVLLGLVSNVYVVAWNWGEHGNFRLWALYFLGMLFTAVQEEVMFRGYLLKRLGDALGRLPAALCLSVLFGAMHFNQPGISVAAITGLACHGLVYSYSVFSQGTVWQAVGLHFTWNLFEGIVFGLPNSGVTESYSLWATSVHGPAWWTGGLFGPEAGMLSLIAFLLIFLAMYTKARRFPTADTGLNGR